MKKWKVFFGLCILILMGCSSPYVSKHAIKDPAKAVSLPHPVEMEKAQVEVITQFVGIMAPELWPEVVASGGVWPTLARNQNGKIFEGFVYLSGITYWGDFLLQFLFLSSREELANAEILYLNRDGGWIYQLNGKEISYQADRFDNDKEYQAEIFKEYGWKLAELNNFWLRYLEQKELTPPNNLSGIQQIKLGTAEWRQFKKKLSAFLKYNYKMADGEIRIGYLPLNEFRQTAVSHSGLQFGDRFIRNLRIPFIFEPIGMTASIANAAVAAAVDEEIKGPYARAKVVRREMVPVFRYICQAYKELLELRDKRIRYLEEEIRFQHLLAK